MSDFEIQSGPSVYNLLSNAIMHDIFKEDGIIAQYQPNYSVRASQKQAAEELFDAIKANKHAIIEGPCGFGKTYVYLTNAVIKAYENILTYGKDAPAVIIATSGIALQEQLFKKDMPDVIDNIMSCVPDTYLSSYIKTSNLQPTYALLKGRQNYICPLKFMKYQTELMDMLGSEKFQELTDTNAATGELNALSFVPEYEVKTMCCCLDAEDCTGRKCPLYKKCHYQAQKEAASSANIIVCNYHVLFSAIEAPILPESNMIIWDEAHEVADIFRHFYVENANAYRIDKIGKNLSAIYKTTCGIEMVQAAISESNHLAQIFDTTGSSLHASFLTEIHCDLSSYINYLSDKTGINQYSDYDDTKIIHPWMQEEQFTVRDNLCYKLNMLLDLMAFIDNKLETCVDEEYDEGEIYTVQSKCTEIQKSITSIKQILMRQHDETIDYAYFLQKHNSILSIERMPIDVGPLIHQTFLHPKYINIFTSATLSTNNNFEFCKSQLGLNLVEPENIFEFIGTSPFNLSEQELWYLPNPCIDGNNKDFGPYFTDTVVDIYKAGGRGMLVLTTSYAAMNQIHSELLHASSTAYDNTLILKQGDMPRLQLLDKFKADGKAVLVATKSFFTGIDVPGSALQILVIDKLPFLPPNDPVVMHMNCKKDSNTFAKYSIPSMIILLKQAVGRGVRSVTDKCVICIADGRMVTARYRGQIGRSFNYDKTATRSLDDVITFLNQ